MPRVSGYTGQQLSPIPNDPRSDAQLVAAAAAGEPSAFDALYRRHRDWAYRLAFRFTGADADAWDVVQETFLYLARRIPSLTLTASLHTLIFPAIRNLAIKANAKRRRLIAGDELLAALPSVPARSPDPANDDLTQILQTLDLPHRQAIILRYIDDLTLKEIAQVLSIPVGTVKSRLFHAHRLLRDNPSCRKYFQE